MQIYGECQYGGSCAQVVISNLRGRGCDIAMDRSRLPHVRDIALWIGAVGPFSAQVVSDNGKGEVALSFDEPLDRRVLEHFAA